MLHLSPEPEPQYFRDFQGQFSNQRNYPESTIVCLRTKEYDVDMSTTLFDTRKADENLINAGCDPQLAKAIVLTIDEALTGGISTKVDIAELKTELRGDTADLRTELRGDIADLRTELKGDISNLEKAILRQTIRLGSGLVAAVLVLAALMKLPIL